MSKNHLGAVYMIMSVLFFSFMDILIKVTDEYDVGQIMFFRALFGLIPILPSPFARGLNSFPAAVFRVLLSMEVK